METRNFKDSTKAAATYLAEQGIDVPHTRLLEALSRAFGERNWSTLSAQLRKLETPSASAPAEAVPAWDISQGPMSDAQYLACGGNRCPFCGSTDLDVDKIDMDGPHGSEKTTCEDCTATWTSAYQLTGYFDGEAGVAHKPSNTALILVRPGVMTTNQEGLLYGMAQARPVLVETLGTDEYISDEELLGMIHDENACIEALKQHGIAHRSRAVRSSLWEVRTVLSMEAREMALTVQAGRKEVIESLVDDVRERARRHSFNVRGWAQALECVSDTNEVLNLDATPAEQFAAASHLA
jgi:hypothetical protein